MDGSGEATFIAVAEDGHAVGQLFVDETVGYDQNTDAFVIRTAQSSPVLSGATGSYGSC